MRKRNDLLGLMSDDECNAIVLSVIQARNDPDGVPEEDLAAALRWAGSVRMDGVLLQAVIKGKLSLDIREGGEAKFSLPGGKAQRRRA